MADLATHLRRQMPRYKLAGDERLKRAEALLAVLPPPASPKVEEHHFDGPDPYPPPPPVQLSGLTKAELLDRATARDIAGRSSMNKAELIEALGG